MLLLPGAAASSLVFVRRAASLRIHVRKGDLQFNSLSSGPRGVMENTSLLLLHISMSLAWSHYKFIIYSSVYYTELGNQVNYSLKGINFRSA